MKLLILVTLLAAVVATASFVEWMTPLLDTRAQELNADSHLRISAQRLETGRVQFGLRAMDVSGDYAQPVEPRQNTFSPSRARVDGWLVSSPLTLEVDGSGRGRLVPSEQFHPASPTERTLVSGVEEWRGDIRYSAYHDELEELVTVVSIYSAADGAPDGELRTTITCQGGETVVTVGGLPVEIGRAAQDGQIPVSWKEGVTSGSSEGSGEWRLEEGTGQITVSQGELADALLEGGSELSLSIGTTPALGTKIDREALVALPVFTNLVYCGADDASASRQSGHTELRIRARVRANQRIEFALQKRTKDGWGEPIAPKARFIDVSGPTHSWLSSTPVSVVVPLSAVTGITFPDTRRRPVSVPINPVLRSGWQSGSLGYATDLDKASNLNSVVTVHGTGDLTLQVGCIGDERRVQLAGAPGEASGAVTLSIDDQRTVATWTASESGESRLLHPATSDRMIERLRGAQTLAVTLDADSTVNTFHLSGLLETPIQSNIDQCGNYTEPAWWPLTEQQTGTTDAGASYLLDYPEWLGGQSNTVVSIEARGEPAGADGLPLVLEIGCHGQDRLLTIDFLTLAEGRFPVRIRVDNEEWIDDQWHLQALEDWRSYAIFELNYGMLRTGSVLEIELLTSSVIRTSFDLTNLFNTPVQPNIDNCGEEPWPQERTYVPIVNVTSMPNDRVSYRVGSPGANGFGSQVWVQTANPERPSQVLSLAMSCMGTNGPQRLSLRGLGGIEGFGTAVETAVSLVIDEGAPQVLIWRAISWEETGQSNVWIDGGREIALLRNASMVTIDVPASGLGPVIFDLDGFFETPVQGNIDECGNYKPGETREPPRALNTRGSRQGVNRHATLVEWQRSQGATSLPSTLVMESRWNDGQRDVGLILSCGPEGTRLFLWGSQVDALAGRKATVTWSLDGMAPRQESWMVTSLGPRNYLSPPKASAIIAAWREAELLDFEVIGPNSIVQRFDLATMFGAPVVETMDRCLATGLPEWTLPVTGIPITSQGDLTYGANAGFGSTWRTSFVRLRAAMDSSTLETAEPGSSPLLTVTCGIDGIGIEIRDIDSAASAVISGDSVDVTWMVDDGVPQTSRWDIWPLVQGYGISPEDDAAFYAAIEAADRLSVSIDSSPVMDQTYNFGGNRFWNTPVQPNLDACGGP